MIHLYFFAFILMGGTPFHVVKKGETLYSISKEYNFSLEDIRAKNKLTEASIIGVGDTIFFPTEAEIEKKEEKYIFHIVQKGETIFWISRNNTQISFDELIKLNHINSNFEINVGQKIIIGYKKPSSTIPKEVLKPDQKNVFSDIKPKPTAKDSAKLKPSPVVVSKPQAIPTIKKDTLAKPKTISSLKPVDTTKKVAAQPKKDTVVKPHTIVKKDTIAAKKIIAAKKQDTIKPQIHLPAIVKETDHLKIQPAAIKKDTVAIKKLAVRQDSTKTALTIEATEKPKMATPSLTKEPDHLQIQPPIVKKDTIDFKKITPSHDSTKSSLRADAKEKPKTATPSLTKEPDHLKIQPPTVKKDTISRRNSTEGFDLNKIVDEPSDYQLLYENNNKGKSNKCLAASLNSGKDFALYNEAAVGSYIKVRNLKTNLSVYLKVIGKLPNLSREKQVCLKMSQAASDKISATGKMFLVEIEY